MATATLIEPRFTRIGTMLSTQARNFSDKPALLFGERSVSYAALDRNSRQVAAALEASGCHLGARIAFLGKNSDVYYEILIGGAIAGVATTPINWRLAEPEIAWILEDARCSHVFVTQPFAETVLRLAQALNRPLQVFVIDGHSVTLRSEMVQDYAEWRDAVEPAAEDATSNPDAIAVQIYTSGTTGRPKGALLSQRALLAFRSLPQEAQPEWNKWSDDDISLIVMPQFHIGGTGFGLQTLCAGATGIVAEEFSAGLVLDAIENRGLSKLFTVPSALQLIMRHPRAREIDYGRIRAIVYGGSPMPIEVLRDALDVFQCSFVQQYGMTEMCGTISVLPPEDHDVAGSARMTSAGKALEGVEIAIVAPDGERLPQGESGEIVIRSPTAMSGYWNLPVASAASFDAEGFFRSGDAGYLDADGYLFLRDRIKDMIVSGGENVFPAEVENAIRNHPDVADVAVIGVPDPLWGEAVKAIVVPRAGCSGDADAICAWARRSIAGYKVPKSVEFLAELPRNPSGKVLRRALREPYWRGQDRAIG